MGFSSFSTLANYKITKLEMAPAPEAMAKAEAAALF